MSEVPLLAISSKPVGEEDPAEAKESPQKEENVVQLSQSYMLISAAANDQLSQLTELFAQGVDPNSTDYDQRSALHVACAEGHEESALVLLEKGANLNVHDRFGLTPMDEAIKSRNASLVGELLKRGGEVSKPSSESSLIATVSQSGDEALRMAELILKAKVDPNCTDSDGRTPLHFAASQANAPMAELLLSAGADPQIQDRWKQTPKSAWKGGIGKLFTSDEMKAEVHSAWSTFTFVFAALQCVIIILMFTVTTYNEGSSGGDEAISKSHMALYPHFQDVNVMVFIGFGYLMTFLKKNIFNSVGLTFMIGAMVVEWHMLVNGFFEQAFCRFQFGEDECAKVWEKIPLGLHNMLVADFCAASIMITYGAVLGKVTPAQLAVMAFFETIFYAINEMYGKALGVTDIGGTMVIHMFGAYFGMAFSLATRRKDCSGHHHNNSVYHSDAFAMIGTLFLWLYWPSFNSAPSLNDAQQQRVIINTFLSVAASCFVAFLMSHVARKERKFCMVDVQNATLAGGVAMGACADLIITPGAAVSIGSIAGIVSVLGFVYVMPFLEHKTGFHDTCGVNNLHGMPSIIGGFSAVIAASFASESTYGPTQLADIFPMIAHHGRTSREQAGAQVAFIFVTLGWSLLTGYLTGYLTKLCNFLRVDERVLFSDENDWEVPQEEIPYYFDLREELERTGPSDLNPGVVQRLAHLEARVGALSKPSRQHYPTSPRHSSAQERMKPEEIERVLSQLLTEIQQVKSPKTASS